MCTAITYKAKDCYFGRNLDLEYAYQESITVTPRNFPLQFRCGQAPNKHYAMIGVATVAEGYPLYYDAVNEKGLGMAALNFPGNAVYQEETTERLNVSSFEFIPWILSQCATVAEAMPLLNRLNIVNIPFSPSFPPTPLHWLLADKDRAVTIEPLADGIRIYENPVGVLTNNPPFDYHVHNLKNYLNLTREEPTNRFAPHLDIVPYSRGMGAFGLPGDLSSASRFIRAAFTKLNALPGDTEAANISQFFHILSAVAQQYGCVKVDDGYEKTVYSSCCNIDKGIYYYTTYENSQITAVDMQREDLNGNTLSIYPFVLTQQIRREN